MAKPNHGHVVVLTSREMKKLRKEVTQMQKEQLQGGPFPLSTNILVTLLESAVPTDLDCVNQNAML